MGMKNYFSQISDDVIPPCGSTQLDAPDQQTPKTYITDT